MTRNDQTLKATKATLNVLYEHDLTGGEALSVLDCVRAVIIVDGLDNGDIDESAAERLLDATALRVRQFILSRGGKNKKPLDSQPKNFREGPKNDQ